MKALMGSKQIVMFVVFLVVGCLFADVASATATAKSVGSLAGGVMGSMVGIAKLIVAGAFVAGMGFAVGAILKFKQHKDNPTQVPVGTPLALIFIAAALMFLPSIFGTLGQTVFGGTTGKGSLKGSAGSFIT